ncbi:ABC transporter ATP-binding protein [bacterium]|nr:ABC transporter ATP-binding protein [bacterium]
MILQIESLYKNFGKTKVIEGVDLEINGGECHAIIGPNGAGKSTLFNLVTGLYKPTSGSIKLKGEEIVGLKPFTINRKGLSRSFQVLNIFHDMSVYENIQCSLLWSSRYKYSFWQLVTKLKDVQERANIVLEQIGMTNRRDVIAGNLAYAEQRLLEIGITIGQGAEIILLDEPTAGLSKHEIEQVLRLIRYVTEGKTLILVEHDMDVVFSISDRISVLVYGKIIATAEPEIIKQNKQVQEAYLGTIDESAIGTEITKSR